MSDIELLKDAFTNSGLIKPLKHDFYPDQLGGDCSPWCKACAKEKETAREYFKNKETGE